MAVEVWNDDGQPVIGEKGELVCTRHFPAMPIGLWNDPDGEKLRASYFSQFPGSGPRATTPNNCPTAR
jgi:acetoacetyl-CoA synthetase